METHSLKGALEGVRTRANCRLSVSILVTEGDTSTLVPVTLDVADLKDMPIEDVRQMLELCAERRFRSLHAEPLIAAAS
ncbi:MAG: hypothetical protein DMF63_15180 [Acidobacteria bacterium]|nr:MAG: hypothetical protein DMF63_15180 [Acidobacteriota bacterium]